MGKLHVLNSKGDTTVLWDPQVKDETDAAEKAYNELRRAGLATYEVEGGKGNTMIQTFKPEAEEIVAFRPLQGG